MSNIPARWHAHFVRPGTADWPENSDDVMEHAVDWLLAQCDREDKCVLVLGDEAGRHVPLFVHNGQIDFSFGDAVLSSVKVRRHVLTGNFSEQLMPAWTPVLSALRENLSSNSAVFLLGVVQGEPLHYALTQSYVRDRFFILTQGKPYVRRLCRLDGSLEAYLASLPAKGRQDLKRSMRRFETTFGEGAEFRVFSGLEEVEWFLRRVEPVSRKTYQARLLGLGIDSMGYIGNKVMEGARRGYSRCYLLSVGGRPIAWRIGFLYRGVYCSHHVGYDPEFEHWHPGAVTHLYSVRDLSECCTGVHTLDMLYGDNDFKRKSSNAFREECNYYLFPRTVRGALTYGTLASSNRLSAFASSVLQHWGLKAKVKAWIRRS